MARLLLSSHFLRVRSKGRNLTLFLTGDWKVPKIPPCGTGKPALRSADIPVRGFGRLSSRPALPAQTFRPRTVSRCTPFKAASGAQLRPRLFPGRRTKTKPTARGPVTKAVSGSWQFFI